MIEESLQLVEPKAVFSYFEVEEVEGEHVILENGEVLTGTILADMLECGQKTAPYVITIGARLETRVSQLTKSNVVQAFLLDRIGSIALRMAKRKVELLVAKELGDKISDFSPGEGTGILFGIKQQTVLFRMLQPKKNIGVSLTSGYLMIPQKSVSGLFAPTDQEYVACSYCPKECEDRKSTFKGQYYSQML